MLSFYVHVWIPYDLLFTTSCGTWNSLKTTISILFVFFFTLEISSDLAPSQLLSEYRSPALIVSFRSSIFFISSILLLVNLSPPTPVSWNALVVVVVAFQEWILDWSKTLIIRGGRGGCCGLLSAMVGIICVDAEAFFRAKTKNVMNNNNKLIFLRLMYTVRLPCPP